MLKYINELITVQIPDKLATGYQIPTYENINSVRVIVRGAVVATVGALNPQDSINITPAQPWNIDGKTLQKLNAPITLNFIVTNPINTNNGIYIWIKRYINAKLQN